ncbi:sensor [Patiriisocius marinistellae]|uniref:Sensor n=1 Tax=Patiriisocius marinistellae TaxID=2494560 RepID=A0A5J4G0U8_9FLAO|nr:FecR family protein [Patiriisocius marinistellae]GEQ85671.1 sensor [Patiriisocius marinistellae]
MEHNNILDKWLNGELSSQELERFNANPDFDIYRNIDREIQKIEVPSHDVETGFADLLQRKSTSKKEIKIFRLSNVLKVAAIFVMLVMSYIFVANIPSTTTAPMANTEQLLLPDDSRITLNKDATVTYKKYGWAFDRNVTLEGEAFFEVAKGKKFTVTTEQGIVTVLGTKFNVSTKNNKFKVSCYEGLVSVSHNNRIFEVTPGNSYTFDNESNVNHIVYTSHPTWIFNESSFTNIDLYSVILALENQFGIAIKTENINVDLRYTGTFTHTNLEDALRTVTVPLNLSYRKDSKNGVTIYNSKK